MEIFNSIWNVLTTENQNITTLIILPLYFVENYVSFHLFTSILNLQYTKKQLLIYVICSALVSIITNFVIPAPFNTFFNWIFLLILIKKMFNISLLKSVLAITIPLITFALIYNLILNPFLKLFSLTSASLELVPIFKFIYLCVVYILIYLIIFIAKRKNFKFILLPDLDKNTNRLILINLVLGILALIVQAVLTFYYINIVPIVITLLNFVVLFAYFFMSFYSLTKTMKLYVATRDLENAESYNNSLTFLYDNVKGFKHDFNNIVNTIGGYINTNDMDGLKKYYNGLQKDCIKVNNMALLNPNIINNPGIYNLIVSEYQKASKFNIKVNLEFFFDFENLHIPIYEFSRILGILFDNAIEAAKDCKEKEINLRFRDSRKESTQIVIIENTYSNKDVDTKKIFEKGVSGKENHTGIGLWEVNQILKKNNNASLHTVPGDKYFKQELQIRY